MCENKIAERKYAWIGTPEQMRTASYGFFAGGVIALALGVWEFIENNKLKSLGTALFMFYWGVFFLTYYLQDKDIINEAKMKRIQIVNVFVVVVILLTYELWVWLM